MKIEIELLDAILVEQQSGKVGKARVARLRVQDHERKPWKTTNIICDSESPGIVVEAVAAYLKSREQVGKS